MWRRWIPWRFIIRKVAQGQGFIDPIALLAQMQRFAQPSEVAAPIELLRLSAVLQARGLMNLQAIQHNLDWIWPHWVVHQFNPEDRGFVPRAFSLTHINLTHRNWTAVGLPHIDQYPVIDPRGLLMPLYDGWSLDAWLIRENNEDLIPSRMELPLQKMTTEGNLAVETVWKKEGSLLSTRIEMFEGAEGPFCRMHISARDNAKAWIALSLRPFNPEGVNLIHEVQRTDNGRGWIVNKKHSVYFDEQPDRHVFSDYARGDVYMHLRSPEDHSEKVSCDVGMASAAALFEVKEGAAREITAIIPLRKEKDPLPNVSFQVPGDAAQKWEDAEGGCAKLEAPDSLYQYLYDTAVRTVLLHSPHEIYPGPYTYKHFWFRDAAIILHAMLTIGMYDRAEKIIDIFPDKQTVTGYFRSQEGEWDSNGQVLWLVQRYRELTGREIKEPWRRPMIRAAKWIQRKRTSEDSGKLHAGLYPAGFSAEHLGPNDYYYWDDFWGVAGLNAAASLAFSWGDGSEAKEFSEEAARFMACIERSLESAFARLNRRAMPSSPYRRMDTGVIGSMAVDYPLKLWEPGDERVMETVEYLLEKCFVEGGFFHDMSHSGINPYLTLHIAQALLRAGDLRALKIMRRIAELASPTGQWPEAIHPQTKGGCMGDGQHVWAAAEWILMMRNCFVREEQGKLIIASGVPPEWLEKKGFIRFGPSATPYGEVTAEIEIRELDIRIACRAKWRGKPPAIEARLPLYNPISFEGKEEVLLSRSEQRPVL